MATQSLDPVQLDLTTSRRTLILVWLNPVSRRFVKVGQLDALSGGRLSFQYLNSAWDDPDFTTLLEYPDRAAAYVSDEVPAFFANRILSSDRPNYEQYLGWLGIEGLKPDDVPFEVLARSGGGRETDTFHVVDLPLDADHSFRSRFFVSGVRHFQGSDELIRSLQNGASLQLKLEENNAVNPKAVLIDAADSRTIGYVPDWLCADVHQKVNDGWRVSVIAERVNPDAPAHIRVLCRIDAERG
jgi:hypothetical protein